MGLAGIQTRLLPAQSRPKLIVLLIGEQFRSDYLDLYSNFLGAGGFRRLTAEGAYFPECQMAASTFTSGGLATIATGAYPQIHGVVADSWYDRSITAISAGNGAFGPTPSRESNGPPGACLLPRSMVSCPWDPA